MKTKQKLLSAVIGAALAFLLSYCAAACFASTYKGYIKFDMTQLLWVCAGMSLVCAGAFSVRRGGYVLLGALALFMGWALQEGTLLLQWQALITAISQVCNDAYDFPLVTWGAPILKSTPGTWALGSVMILTNVLAVFVLVRREWSVWALVPVFLPFAACFIATDLTPEPPWIFGLFFAAALLLLTQSVRRRDPAAGIKITAMLLIPLFLASVLLFAAAPRSKYEEQSTALQACIFGWFNSFFEEPGTGPGTGVSTVQNLDLADVGPKSQLRYAVMDVKSDQTQLLYLRGQAMDDYSGTNWRVSDAAAGPDLYWPTRGLEQTGEIVVFIRVGQKTIHFPYYTQGGLWTDTFQGGALPNPDEIREYTMPIMQLQNPQESGFMEHTALYEQCLTLPEDTRAWAEGLLAEQGILSLGSAREQAEAIRDYVSACAEYDLDTQRMPEEQTDFAYWFLTEAETGYCVHFATAATVLLRAAGIPARYVTGYTVDTVQGLNKTVTADRAHAWTEYILPGTGWTMLDATPPEALADPTEPPTTEPSETTEPPTEPSESTGPSESTEPTQEPTVQPTEEPSTQPPASTGNALPGPASSGEPWQMPDWLRPALISLAAALAVGGGLWGQYDRRKKRRRARCTQGDANVQALHRWRYVLRLSKLLKQEIPEALEQLAEKAKFSQHTLTAAELHQFDAFIRTAHKALKKRPWPLRVFWKLIFAVG